MTSSTAIAATALPTATLLSGTGMHPAQAVSAPTWNKNVHCKATATPWE
ncbi:hypothetical protein AB0952_35895 [Streptomyces caniferus]